MASLSLLSTAHQTSPLEGREARLMHESPDRSRIRFEPFREPEGLGSLLLRQLQSRRGRIENLLAVCPKFMGCRPMNGGAIVREVRVECSAHGVKRVRPRFMDRRSNMTAPEAS